VASAVPWIANRPRSSSQSSAAPPAALIALSSETRRRKLARSLASGCERRPRHCCGEGLSNCGEYELDRLRRELWAGGGQREVAARLARHGRQRRPSRSWRRDGGSCDGRGAADSSFVFGASSSKSHGGGLGIGAGPSAHVMGSWRRTRCVRRPVQPAVAADGRLHHPCERRHVPRRRGQCPRLLAAVVRSCIRSAPTAERQVVDMERPRNFRPTLERWMS
jgi:hypothetical protein